MKLMPQEIEVRYIIPSIRKELAKALVAKDYKQKEVAQLLEITPAAISQYMKEKRGTINFDSVLLKDIKKSADLIVKDPSKLQSEIFKLTKSVKTSGAICQIHRKYDKVPAQCELCFYNEDN